MEWWRALKIFLLAGGLAVSVVTAGAEAEDQSTSSLRQLKVAAYNIHGCVGRDGKIDLPRIARVLQAGAPDIVALNEVYRYSDGVTQDEELARVMGEGWTSVFGKTIRKPAADYGNAIMTRLPIISSEVWSLDEFPKQERRGVLRVTVRHGTTPVHVFCTHMGLSSAMREKNAAQLLEIMSQFTDAPVILMGDFNEVPPGRGLDLVEKSGYTDAWRVYGLSGGKTYPSRPALRRLDYIFFSGNFVAESCYVGTFDDALMASDHRPVFASLLDRGVLDNAQELPDDAVWFEAFEKEFAGGADNGWTTDSSGRNERRGHGYIRSEGEAHFWVQESTGTLTFQHTQAEADQSENDAWEFSARFMMESAGDGWEMGLGSVSFRVRHAAGQLPHLELLVAGDFLSSATLANKDIDPYDWNSYTLHVRRGDEAAVKVWINGQLIASGRLSAPVQAKASRVWLSTHGGGKICRVFADDLVMRRVARPDVAPPVHPQRVIEKADQSAGTWWKNLW